VHRSKKAIAVALGCATVCALGGTSATAAMPVDTSELRKAVTAEGALEHERQFQAIADANGDTRASGTPGYDASVDYVAGLLTNAGYQVSRQEFEYDLFVETADPVLDLVSPDRPAYVPGEAFITMSTRGPVM
jgi:hypothetical protein